MNLQCQAWRVLLALGLLVLAQPVYPEQSVTLAGYEVHYSVVNSTFLQPEVAARYAVVRADNRAVLTVALRHDDSKPVPNKVTGSITNLLSQQIALEFRLLEEGETRYYLTTFLFTNEEPLTFTVQIHTSDGPQEFTFKRQVFTRWD